MKRSGIAGLMLAAALLCGCGNGGAVRYYRGTNTETSTSGSNTTVSTYNGTAVTVLPSADNSQWLFLIGGVEFSALLNGATLTFANGQDLNSTHMSGTNTSTSMATLNNGTGNMSPTNLSLNLTLTITENSGTSTITGSSTYNFNGTRE